MTTEDAAADSVTIIVEGYDEEKFHELFVGMAESMEAFRRRIKAIEDRAFEEVRTRHAADEPAPAPWGPWGTCRDLTFEDVKAIVANCRTFAARGGKVTQFYAQQDITPGEPRSYELGTLRTWLKDPRFR